MNQRGHYPGWDARKIASAILINSGEDDEDTSAWSDEHLDDFLNQFNLEIVEDRTAFRTYTLSIYKDSQHIADITEFY